MVFGKRVKRFINRQSLRQLRERPGLLGEMVGGNFGGRFGIPTPTLATRSLVHVANFSFGNAGDALLPITLRDLMGRGGLPASWRLTHAHDDVTDSVMQRLNSSHGVVVGGGGLFLRDTNRNDISGWQWPISVEKIRSLKVPLAVFAVGYNRFRGQDDFDSIFVENLIGLVEKSAFFGLRNTGSIEAIRGYLPDSLRGKIEFQPCMTTVLRKIYPPSFFVKETNRPIIALNCAFDRSDYRFGNQRGKILSDLAGALESFTKDFEIRYFAHCPSDEQMLPALREAKIPFRLERLYNRTPMEIIRAVSQASLVLGMRGHAQMIPFGSGVPILSLISHDKVKWFLADIDALDWGVELKAGNLRETLVSKIGELVAEQSKIREQIDLKMEKLWRISCANVGKVTSAIFS